MPSFDISPATLQDLPSIAAITYVAFKDKPNTISHWILPHDDEEAMLKWRLRRITDIFDNSSQVDIFKCVDPTNQEITSYALWQRPTNETRMEEGPGAKAEKGADAKKKHDDLPEGVNKALMQDFDNATQQMRDKYVNPEKDFVLLAIATHPKHQGRGCASALLRSGLGMVDARKARVFLEGTSQARPLYESMGWKFVDEIVVDVQRYGCSGGVQRVTCMMREVVG